MKLRYESGEKPDFSGPKGEIENCFSGRDCTEVRRGPKGNFRPEKSGLSLLAVEGFMNNPG